VRLELNGETSAFPEGTTVEQVVTTICQRPRGVAVAVNAEVVPRSTWGATVLREGDRVEVLTAAQGG
jgi:sulfur carrier protein